ncbi:MAG: electron transfer flavoprotein subunit alpha/FixB family protein [Syntrophomonadaceae bacterium]|jgi:electron transfer flavoprotein alpha subunit|nr:electron transfer flavoprotein subunit alpha/FixB family protein [Syntrophomonadaceae bacterium]
MAGIFIYSEKTDIAAELISFAKASGQDAYAITFEAEAAEAIRNYGAKKVFVLKGDSPIAENYAKSLAAFLKNESANLFVVGATARGRDLAARTAGYLGCGMVSDASAISYVDGTLLADRMLYGGAVIQSEALTGMVVVTIAAGKFTAAAAESAEIVSVDVTADNRVKLVNSTPIIKEGCDLRVADKVVCVGMGMDKPEDLKMAEELASALGAEIGCTRGIAEERHWLPVEQYIGISGAVVTPNLYIAMGVSGQVQHVVGVREAKIIVAIDKNEKAPIFRAADYGIVGDMYEIVPLLIKAIKTNK